VLDMSRPCSKLFNDSLDDVSQVKDPFRGGARSKELLAEAGFSIDSSGFVMQARGSTAPE